jgi:flagellin-specific chaperone FliS
MYSVHAIAVKDIAVTSQYLTPKEVAGLIDKAVNSLNEVSYYCLVENKIARGKAVNKSKALLQHLVQVIDASDGNHVAENLQKLLQFMIYSLDTINKNNNPAAAQECASMLQPLRDAILA